VEARELKLFPTGDRKKIARVIGSEFWERREGVTPLRRQKSLAGKARINQGARSNLELGKARRGRRKICDKEGPTPTVHELRAVKENQGKSR